MHLHAVGVERLLQHLRRIPQALVARIVLRLVRRQVQPYVCWLAGTRGCAAQEGYCQ